MHYSVHRRFLALAAFATLSALLAAWTADASPSRSTKSPGPIVTVGSTTIGSILIDGRGRTLYLYTPDKKSTSVCYGVCASFWPPLLTTSKAVGKHGVKQSLLSTTKRKDGKLQVTYAGHPLYYFAEDSEAGDVNGQGFQNIWYAVDVTGARVAEAAPEATVALTKNDTIGQPILTDAKGMTLYLFKKDVGTTSSCYGGCATLWPPLLLQSGSPLRAGPGLKTSLLGTTGRTDGAVQVTYAGHPLYYFAKDTKAGDTNGQKLGTVWFVVSATGDQIGG
jgi:predicted lipoprotein with Yx(FWY)xxD motif